MRHQDTLAASAPAVSPNNMNLSSARPEAHRVGFVEHRSSKGSHRLFVHPANQKVITVSVHTKKEVGTGLAHRILKEAGL